MGKLAIDDEMLDEIAALAKERGISSERLAHDILRDALRSHRSKEGLRDLLESIASLTPPDVQQSDSVKLLREDRER